MYLRLLPLSNGVKFLRTVTKLKLKEKGKFVNYEFFKSSSMEHRIRGEVVPWMGFKEMYQKVSVPHVQSG